MVRLETLLALAASPILLVLPLLAGCNTTAYCFTDCATGSTSAASGAGGEGGGSITVGPGGSGGSIFATSSSAGGGTCVQTNGGIEKCDGVDNDCNGKVDDSADIDFNKITTCGTCDNNCLALAVGCDQTGVVCTPSADPGNTPGTCSCTACAPGKKDLDNDGLTCEYTCPLDPPAADDSICNKIDDDCDGIVDEDVDVCTSVTDCGGCGHNCSLPHATATCVNDGNMPCDLSNTKCQIAACDCNGPGDCWWDVDPNVVGCEYQCDETNGGVEICDGIDNDCDGLIDNADDLSGDPALNQPCFGDPDGLCATPAHQGATVCKNAQVVCDGPNVLHENDSPEICNSVDDDCNGVVDDSPTDAGGSCGVSNIFPCSLGTFQCQNGGLVCVGEIDPGVETCNGQDDDCDGKIDKTGANPPADSVGPCNVPPPPPPMATSPCMAGAKQCQGGVVICVGSVGPTGPVDTCGVDANCDGQLTNQPDINNDPKNCGMCGNDCTAGAVHAQWGCQAKMCKFLGCDPGFYDLNADNKCEYACTFVSAQESCNGIDDNCNGQIDEGVVKPTPVQVCGVSPSAVAPECTSGVTVACQNGGWKCTFPANVCNGGNPASCSTTPEICDALDNNCNGALNENVPTFGKACASDDGKPPPGDGACRTVGTFICNGANAVKCSAVKDNTKAGAELCDGLDNDCDGLVDEPFSNKGSNATFFVKPSVTKISATRWIYSYEASRPSSTGVIPGSGNGYWTSAPNGVTLDKTPACSVPTKIPWFNVTGTEAEQTCTNMGGFLCTADATNGSGDWEVACNATLPCTFGYNPRTAAACNSAFTGTKFCNLGISYDFTPNCIGPNNPPGCINGDQDGLLPTASGALQNCWADWSALQGNAAADAKIFDMTGNLREITKDTVTANTYHLMGGAFNSQSEAGAACNYTFYTVDQNFQYFDAGFRCCFSADPRL